MIKSPERLSKDCSRISITIKTYILNSILRTGMVLIFKPEKPVEGTSYHSISSLPDMSKLFEKLSPTRLKPVLDVWKLILNYQFGFHRNCATVEQNSWSNQQILWGKSIVQRSLWICLWSSVSLAPRTFVQIKDETPNLPHGAWFLFER